MDGVIDEGLFRRIVDRLILKARSSNGKGCSGQVRIFGEMVSLLWNTNLPAATRLEELSNQVIDAHSVSLRCTYPLNGLARDAFPERLLACHSHSV